MSEATELITEIFYCLWNKRLMKRGGFYLENPYDTINVLAVREYFQLLAEVVINEELATKAATCYIKCINNLSVEWFAQQIGTCSE